MQTKFNVIN